MVFSILSKYWQRKETIVQISLVIHFININIPTASIRWCSYNLPFNPTLPRSLHLKKNKFLLSGLLVVFSGLVQGGQKLTAGTKGINSCSTTGGRNATNIIHLLLMEVHFITTFLLSTTPLQLLNISLSDTI